MTETQGRQWFRKLMEPYITGKLLKFQPIESPSTGLGIPDWWFKTVDTEGWIEEKTVRPVNENGVKIDWRPGQFRWMRDYVRLHGLGFLFVFTDHGMYHSLTVFMNDSIRESYSMEEFTGLYCFSVTDIRDVEASVLYDVLKVGHQ